MTRASYCEDKQKYSYDYENQVWIRDGKYQDCNHPKGMDCNCFGRIHAGEQAVISEACH